MLHAHEKRDSAAGESQPNAPRILRLLLIGGRKEDGERFRSFLLGHKNPEFEFSWLNSLSGSIHPSILRTFDLLVLAARASSQSELHSVSRLRRYLPSIPVLVMTPSNDVAILDSYLQAGATRVMTRRELNRETLVAGILASVGQNLVSPTEQPLSRLDDVLERSPVGHWQISADTRRTLYLNSSMRHLLELDPADDLSGESFDSYFTPQSLDLKQSAGAGPALPAPLTYEAEVVGKRGGVRPVLVSEMPVWTAPERPPYILAAFTDLTRYKAAEFKGGTRPHTLDWELDRLWMEKMESVGKLAGTVAEEVSNLLTVIGGYAELLRQEAGRNEQHQSRVESILRAVNRGAAFTEELFTIGDQQPSPSGCTDLNQVVESLTPRIRAAAGDRVEVIAVLGQGLAPVNADRKRLEQAILDLSRGACRNLSEGGTLTLQTCRQEDNSGVALKIVDSVGGQSSLDLRRFFDPFYLSSAPSEGLGMSRAYRSITSWGGRVELDSPPGQPTTLTVVLPAAAPQNLYTVGRQITTRTILLVTEDSALKGLLREILAQDGYHVLEAMDEDGAISVAERHRVRLDLLLTDRVPRSGGVRLAWEVRQAHPEMQVLYLQTHPGQAPELRGEMAENRAIVLEKPFSVERLRREISRLLG